MAPRFALNDGAGLRAARWFGRILGLLSLWPLWYGFFGRSQLDWEALMFGGPGLLAGLALWGWAGYRLRHPLVYLEIDRQAGVARLQRGEGDPLVCELEALGEWTFTSWKTTSTGKHRTVTTWHAVRCPGFGEHNLYVDLGAAECRAWIRKVDAALRGQVEAATTTTVGGLLAERFDALVVASSGSVATIGLTLITGLLAFASVRQLARTDDDANQAAVLLAIVLGLLALGWRVARGPAVAAAIAGLMGAAFVSKPWLAPVTRELMGEVHRLSPTSETHLYYVIPGLGLCVLAVALLSTITVRKAGPPTPMQHEQVKLERPRPDPPKPPGS